MPAIDGMAVVSGVTPSIPLLVFVPVESAVPAAAESVTGDDALYVKHMLATGNRNIVSGVSEPRTWRLYISAATAGPMPIPSPM